MTPDEALNLLDRCYHSPATNVVRAEVERLRNKLDDLMKYGGRDALAQRVARAETECERLRSDLAAEVAMHRADERMVEQLRADLAAARDSISCIRSSRR